MTASDRILGIDYGSKRIGIAISDPLKILAQGLGVVPNSPAAPSEIAEIVSRYGVNLIVVGMPLTLKGEVGHAGSGVRAFMDHLSKATGVEVVEWDERFTSRTAHDTLLEMGVKKKRRASKEIIDTMAAALILQGYLDRRKKISSESNS